MGKLYSRKSVVSQVFEFNKKQFEKFEGTFCEKNLNKKLIFLGCFLVGDKSLERQVFGVLRKWRNDFKGKFGEMSECEKYKEILGIREKCLGVSELVVSAGESMMKKVGEKGEFEMNVDDVVLGCLNPCLREFQKPMLLSLYCIGGRIVVGKYGYSEVVKICEEYPVSGVFNKMMNIF